MMRRLSLGVRFRRKIMMPRGTSQTALRTRRISRCSWTTAQSPVMFDSLRKAGSPVWAPLDKVITFGGLNSRRCWSHGNKSRVRVWSPANGNRENITISKWGWRDCRVMKRFVKKCVEGWVWKVGDGMKRWGEKEEKTRIQSAAVALPCTSRTWYLNRVGNIEAIDRGKSVRLGRGGEVICRPVDQNDNSPFPGNETSEDRKANSVN